MTAADAVTILTVGGHQVASTAGWILLIVLAGIGALTVLSAALGAAWVLLANHARNRGAVYVVAPRPAEDLDGELVPVGDVTHPDVLAHSCGVCNGVPAATRCICDGPCGSQRCGRTYLRAVSGG